MSKIEKISNLKKIKSIKISEAEAMDAVKTLIRWAGDDPQREGLQETPKRVVKSYKDFFSGYQQEPREILSKKFKISKNQNVIEYSPEAFKYLKIICEIIQKNDGGILIIDYGYLNSKMHETLQAIKNHKYSNVIEDIGESDITYNINFNLFEKFISQFSNLKSIVTNQKKFLTSMGILQRAEMVSKNIPFSKKADLFYRIRRLIDEKQMGTLFKVMLIKNNKNKFKTGFQID